MNECQRCGRKLPYGHPHVMLVGEVLALICTRCGIEHLRLMLSNRDHREIEEIEAEEKRLAAYTRAGHDAGIEAWHTLVHRKRRARLAVHEATLRFLDTRPGPGPEESLPA